MSFWTLRRAIENSLSSFCPSSIERIACNSAISICFVSIITQQKGIWGAAAELSLCLLGHTPLLPASYCSFLFLHLPCHRSEIVLICTQHICHHQLCSSKGKTQSFLRSSSPRAFFRSQGYQAVQNTVGPPLLFLRQKELRDLQRRHLWHLWAWQTYAYVCIYGNHRSFYQKEVSHPCSHFRHLLHMQKPFCHCAKLSFAPLIIVRTETSTGFVSFSKSARSL